jgi:protein SCO1
MIENFLMRLLFPLLLLTPLAACEKSDLPARYVAGDVTGQFEQADFHLIDHNGKPRSLNDFRGKVVALFFGYTHCPDVCPTKMADLTQTMRLLGTDAERVQVLFVTLDPERDTRELLAKFVPAFHSSFLGLYGDARATEQVAKNFKMDFHKHATTNGYTLDHTTFTYLIDAQGKLRLMAGDRQPAQMLAQDIRLLLASAR